MIPKVTTGSSFSGVLNYALQESKNVKVIDKNVLGRNAKELAESFEKVANFNTRAEKKVKHFSLSFAQEDKEKLNPGKLSEISQKFLQKMGYKNNQFIVIQHNDTKHPHVHIVVNRIDPTTCKAVSDSNEKLNGSRISREIEREFGLTVAPEKRTGEKVEGKNERELKKRIEGTDEKTDKEAIKATVLKALKGSSDMPEAMKKIRASGIKTEFTSDKKGNVTGWKLKLNDREYKGSTIDRTLSWEGAKRINQESNHKMGNKL
jgi:hypothetical protein